MADAVRGRDAEAGEGLKSQLLDVGVTEDMEAGEEEEAKVMGARERSETSTCEGKRELGAEWKKEKRIKKKKKKKKKKEEVEEEEEKKEEKEEKSVGRRNLKGSGTKNPKEKKKQKIRPEHLKKIISFPISIFREMMLVELKLRQGDL